MLPEETISCITNHIESYESLKNMALCSSQFHRISVPCLYSHVHLRNEDTSSFIHLRDLTALLLRKPEYAHHVRHFTLRDDFQTGTDDNFLEENMKQETTQLEIEEVFKEAIKKYSHSKEEEDKWLDDVARGGNEDALLGLLLPALFKLQRLDLCMPFGDAPYFMRLLTRVGQKQKPFDTAPTLLALNEIMNTASDEKYGIMLDYVPLYLGLPAIRGIYCHRVGSGDDDDTPHSDLAALERGTSSVVRLELKDCKINAPDIIQMLHAPVALENFVYELGWGHLSYCSHSFPAIQTGLDAQKGSLKNLWLDYAHDIEWLTDNSMDDLTPMSFLDFKALKHIRIGTVFIFGEEGELDDEGEREIRNRFVNILPPTIETFRITRCADHFERVLLAVEGLLEHKEQRFRHLQTIVLEAPWPHKKEFWEKTVALLKLANSKGVGMTTIDDKTVGEPSFGLDWPERKWGMDENIEWAEGYNALNTQMMMEVVDIQH